MNGPVRQLQPAAESGPTKFPFAALPLIVCGVCGAVTTEDSRAKHDEWHWREEMEARHD